MKVHIYPKLLLGFIVSASSLALGAGHVAAQDIPATATAGAAAASVSVTSASEFGQTADLRALSDSVRALKEEVESLRQQVRELQEEQQSGRANDPVFRPEESTEKGLGRDLNVSGLDASLATAGLSYSPPANDPHAAATSHDTIPAQQNQAASAPDSQPQTTDDRLDKIEEQQQFIDAKVNDQYQTKVESGSKYRLRLSGMVLLNLYDDRGSVDNQDFPEESLPRNPINSSNSFGGTLRQSQIGLDAFGPDIAGAHTSGSVKFDFAGGFPDTTNGVSQGLVRLRTGFIRFDWSNTSVIAGQDRLFFVPLTPTSLASLAVPALSYAGNLWNWSPQVRVEHRHNFTENSSLFLQAGILDSLSGDVPFSPSDRQPTWGEESGQPAYAARAAWSRHISGRDLIVGFGGYYGRQNWGFGRNVDGWAATMDVTVPLGKWFGLTGAFYRGRAVGGLSGAIGQDVLTSGPIFAATTVIQGLDSAGGWMQLKIKPTPKLELNAAFGDDNPFAGELRRFNPVQSLYGVLLSKNLSPFANVIYQMRSDVVIALEYRRLQTFVLNSGSTSANHMTLSLGYTF